MKSDASHDRLAEAPIIETERLRLRGHRREDLADCVAMWSDATVVRFIGGKPSSPQQTWGRLLGYVGHWSVMQFGYWVIEDKTAGAYLGEIGFADFKREIAPAMRDVPELGWALPAHAHGKGYATEAARAAVAWADDVLGAARTVCLIDTENIASIRVAEKCGYKAFEEAAFNGRATLFFSRSKQSFFQEPPT